MRRLRRWVFNGLAVLSLVLCMATGVLWIRSYAITDHFTWVSRSGNRQIGLISSLDRLELYWEWPTLPGSLSQFASRHHWAGWPIDLASPVLWPSGRAGAFGFYFGTQTQTLGPSYVLIAPIWVVFVLVLFLPAFRGWLWWRAISRKLAVASSMAVTLCPKCHYNLTGNVSGICPECGTAVRAEVRGQKSVKCGRRIETNASDWKMDI